MYRLFSSLGRQRQRSHISSLHRPPASVRCPDSNHRRLLSRSLLPPPSFLTHASIRSLASSSRSRPRLSHSPNAPLPTLPATPAPTLLSLMSPFLQPVFGRHTTPFRLLSLLSFVFLCHLFVFDLFTGHGPSMLPTFAMSGEVFLVEAVSRYTLLASAAAATASGAGGEASSVSMVARVLSGVFMIGRGDVVLCINPVRAQHSVAKRVIGLPGDLVRASLNEPNSLCCVPAGHMWLQGDCLEASRDSREYGAVPLELVRGKVVAKVWPISKAKWIERTLQYRGY